MQAATLQCQNRVFVGDADTIGAIVQMRWELFFQHEKNVVARELEAPSAKLMQERFHSGLSHLLSGIGNTFDEAQSGCNWFMMSNVIYFHTALWLMHFNIAPNCGTVSAPADTFRHRHMTV